jgi:four helix bundle protein
MNPSDLKDRTKSFAVRIVKLGHALPQNSAGWVLGKQLLRSGTSVAANYRAVCRSRSDVEFIAKMGVVIEEADETAFWLELLVASDVVAEERLAPLLKEANELLRICASSRTTVSKRISGSVLQKSIQKSKIKNQK